MNNIKVKLKLYSLHGSIRHYYHFFFGVFVPLIYKYIEYSKKYDNITFIIVDDLGPMLRLLISLPIDIKYKIDKIEYDEEIYILPLDFHPTPNKRDLNMLKKGYAQPLNMQIVNQIKNWFVSIINLNDMYIKPLRNYDIVIIERKTNKQFHSINYIQSKDVILNNRFKTSGRERRVIVNHNELVQFVKNKYTNLKCINVSFEFLPIFEQFYLMNKAKLVISQHGAALGNIIFMRKNMQVVEIIDKILLDSGENWFKPITDIVNVKHYQFITHNKKLKSYIDPDEAIVNLSEFDTFLDENISFT